LVSSRPDRQGSAIDDPLTEILRAGAKRLVTQAVKAECESFLDARADLALPDGRRRSFATGAIRRA
jgi:hypothetical protein